MKLFIFSVTLKSRCLFFPELILLLHLLKSVDASVFNLKNTEMLKEDIWHPLKLHYSFNEIWLL